MTFPRPSAAVSGGGPMSSCDTVSPPSRAGRSNRCCGPTLRSPRTRSRNLRNFWGSIRTAPWIGRSPLFAAASRGKVAVVERLLALGANLHDVHPLYGSALHVAVQSGSPETVRILLAAGLPADIKNGQGLTPRAMILALRK